MVNWHEVQELLKRRRIIRNEGYKDCIAYGALFILTMVMLLILLWILILGEIKIREPCLPWLLFEICLLLGIAILTLERIVTLLYRVEEGLSR